MQKEEIKKGMKAFKSQATALIKSLPEEKSKKESILHKLVRLTRMAALGKKYKQSKPKTKRKIGGVYAAYARRTAAPKTK